MKETMSCPLSMADCHSPRQSTMIKKIYEPFASLVSHQNHSLTRGKRLQIMFWVEDCIWLFWQFYYQYLHLSKPIAVSKNKCFGAAFCLPLTYIMTKYSEAWSISNSQGSNTKLVSQTRTCVIFTLFRRTEDWKATRKRNMNCHLSFHK